MKPLPPGNLWLVHLRRLRAEKRVTVRELAEKTDLTPATVSRLENLKQSARPITAQVIADALGVQVSDLLGEEEQEPPEADPLPDAAEAATPAA
jgi:transcriptional regulator with XRE-family HTH domain